MDSNSSTEFAKTCRNHLFYLRFHLDRSRSQMEKAELAFVTSRWLLDKIEVLTQAQQQKPKE